MIATLFVAVTLGFYPQNDFQYKDKLVQYRPAEMHVFCASCFSPTQKKIQKTLPVTMPELAELPHYLVGAGGAVPVVKKDEDMNSKQGGKQAPVAMTKVKDNSFVSCNAVVEDVYFDFNSEVLNQSEKDKLNRFVVGKKIKKMYLTGFTDKSGRASYNNELALSRSAAVKSYLISKGIAVNVIENKGYGKCCYQANDTQSRRVELKGLFETAILRSD